VDRIIDVEFLLDRSGSIRDNDEPGQNNWRLIVNFVKSIVGDLQISPDRTRVAAVSFGKFAPSAAISCQTAFTD